LTNWEWDGFAHQDTIIKVYRYFWLLYWVGIGGANVL
jgi:hypothetical protein